MASKQRRRQKTTTDQMPVESMRSIFDDSQRIDKHKTCLQRMICLQNMYSRTNQSITNFYKELVRNIKYTLWVQDWRSPYGQNTIGFIIEYLLTFGQQTDFENNEELRNELIDTILEDVAIPYTNSKKPECRINACHFIRRLAEELEDINDEIYEDIKRALLDRSVDRIASVRAAAILALHRFQDVTNKNDLAIQAIHFHLDYDPDCEVRHNSLKSMAASISLDYFIKATRDVKDFIRKTAYIQISEKLQIQCFTIEKRLTILKNGLKDRSSAVRKVVESVLIPSWIKSCNNDLIELLIKLDIQTDIELIERLLEIYFKHLINEKVSEDSNKTKFIDLVDKFRDKYLAKDRVFGVDLNVENVFLWRYLCEFCKTNQIESQELITNEISDQTSNKVQTEEQIPEDMLVTNETLISEQVVDEPRIQKVDMFDLLVPDVPYFCVFLEKFLTNVINQEELSINDVLEFEFIFHQLMKVSLLLDIEDEAQKKVLIKTMHNILMDNNIDNKFDNYITPIMKCLAKKGFSDTNSYLDFTVEIISEIIVSQTVDENESIADESNKEMEEKRDQMTVDIVKYRNEIKDLESEDKLHEIEELYKKIEALELEVKTIKQKITINTLSQYSQTSQTPNSTSLTDHPAEMRCLHIFSGCLDFGDFDEVNAVMQTHIEKVCLPGILSGNTKIRSVATRCLGLVCLTSAQYFQRYLHFLIEIFSKDTEPIKLIALESIFDSLCEHGINIFKDKASNYCGGGDEPQVEPFEESDEDFITKFKQFFATQLDSDNDEIKQTTARGISKLLIHCRMYSPELLSKLIIILFTPNENQAMVQFISDFLRLYSLAESQGVIVGQTALEEALVITLQTIYDNKCRLNCDNLIKLFLKLIAEESHVKLTDDLVKRMLETDEIKLIEDFFLSAVSQLNLIEMDGNDLQRFETNISKIEEKLEKKSKKVIQRLNTIQQNIENRRQQLSADSAFADDFRSVEDNNEDICDRTTLSLDLDDITDDQLGSDSDADSFTTCPESPLMKRRKLSENCDQNESLTQTIASEAMASNEINDIDVNEIQNNEMNQDFSELLDTNTEQTIETTDQPIDKNCDRNESSNQTIASGMASIEINETQNNETNEDFSQSLVTNIERITETIDQPIDETLI